MTTIMMITCQLCMIYSFYIHILWLGQRGYVWAQCFFLSSCFTMGCDSKWRILMGEYRVTLVYCFSGEFSQRKLIYTLKLTHQKRRLNVSLFKSDDLSTELSRLLYYFQRQRQSKITILLVPLCSRVNTNTSNTTLCSTILVFLKDFSMNWVWRIIT